MLLDDAKVHTTTAKINFQLIPCTEIQTLDATTTPQVSCETVTYKAHMCSIKSVQHSIIHVYNIIHVYATHVNQNFLILLPLVTTPITTL